MGQFNFRYCGQTAFQRSQLLKKVHTVRVKFYLGPNEDCSPRDSTSDSLEKLFQRGNAGRSVHVILVKEEFTQSST